MDIQKERGAFEAWYCRNHTGLKQSDLAKFRTLSGYSFSDSLKINVSWEAWQAAKAQAVPERTNQTFEDWLDDPENTKVYLGGYRERANEFAHQAWRASLKAKLPKDKILMPRSLDQKSIDYVVHQLAISSGISLIAEVYACLIEAQEPTND